MKAYQINLTALCHKLSVALTAECSPVQAGFLLAIFKKGATAKEYAQWSQNEDGAFYVDIAYLFETYADWVTDIGMALGFDCQSDESAGEWITDDMPKVKQIMKDIRTIIAADPADLDERLMADMNGLIH